MVVNWAVYLVEGKEGMMALNWVEAMVVQEVLRTENVMAQM